MTSCSYTFTKGYICTFGINGWHMLCLNAIHSREVDMLLHRRHAVNLHALPFKNSIIELTDKWLCTVVHSTGKFDPISSDMRISNLNCAHIVSKATGRVGGASEEDL